MCYAPMNVKISGKRTNGRRFVPCGMCARCEQRKRNDWAFRLQWESKDHPYSWFSMLTYNENTVPWLNTSTGEIIRLNKKDPWAPQNINDIAELEVSPEWKRVPQKKDVQDFIKRLRSQQKYMVKTQGIPDTEIRYYIVAEYGEQKTERPHYHAVLFGVHPEVRRKMVLQKEIWNNGIATARKLDTDSPSGFLYMTKYLFKQQKLDCYPVKPFQLMSKVPYLGNSFEKYAKKYIWKNKMTLIRSPTQLGVWHSIPRIYKERLPALHRAIYTHNDLVLIDNNYVSSLDICNKIGNKPEELLTLEKKAYYQKKYREELELMKHKYLKTA